MVNRSFVQEFCQGIIDRHGVSGLESVKIIIPSQRVALYIKKAFSELVSEPFWYPSIEPINKFLEQLHDFQVVGELEAVFELYESYCEVFDKPESLDDFLSWSSMILSDFNEIDKYLLDSQQVFRNLQSIKEIESWSFNSEELTETQKKFQLFWDKLGELYLDFNSRLEQKGLCTNARVYRNIAENLMVYLSPVKEKVYFIGFNALSAAEQQIMKFIVNSGIGEVYWDADNYYLSNPIMEAGKFMRKYQAWSNPDEWIAKENIDKRTKRINIIAGSSNIQQTSIVHELLHNLESEENVAVVFSDEGLLKPMLNVLPEKIERLNVAMGYPIAQAAVYSLYEEIIQVQQSYVRYRNKTSIYYKDFQRIVSHFVFQKTFPEVIKKIEVIDKKIVEENYSFIPYKMIGDILNDCDNSLMFLFQSITNMEDLMSSLIYLFEKVHDVFTDDLVEREAAVSLLVSLQKVKELQTKYKRINTISSVNVLSRQVLKGTKVSFLGEPLEGLQFLGLLETRALDFKKVILVSANEEILPKKTFSSSIIPHDLRVYLGLPTRDEHDAIFAYYFYRLIQRANEVDVIYNAGEMDKMGSGEVSRYVLQIMEELDPNFVEITQVQPVISENEEYSQDIVLDRELLNKRIVAWLENGLSASAINKFRECPRNFFYTHLLTVRQEDVVEEDIEASTYGTIVHEVLEELFKEEGRLVGVSEIDEMLVRFESYLHRSFEKRFPSKNYLSGKNLLSFETAKHTVKKFLLGEKDLVKSRGVIKIIGLEKSFQKELTVKTPLGEVVVKVKGLIDRIDLIGNELRVVDYKTGRIDGLKFNGEISDSKPYVFQLLTYLYLLSGSNELKGFDGNVNCGMISFKELGKGLQSLFIGKDQSVDVNWIQFEFIRKYEEYLRKFVLELFSSDYSHNSKAKYCLLC